MDNITTVGINLAKNGFQVHGIGSDGKILLRKKLKRSDVLPFFSDLPSCLIGMEACSSPHNWGRTLRKMGHSVKLMPAA